MTSKVFCRTWKSMIFDKGYVEPRTTFFQQFRRKYYVCGIPLWSRALFTEEVPIWAKAQYATLGSTEWRSAAPQWMHDEANKNAKK